MLSVLSFSVLLLSLCGLILSVLLLSLCALILSVLLLPDSIATHVQLLTADCSCAAVRRMTLPVQQALIGAAAAEDLGAIISVLPPEEIAAAGGLQLDEADGLLAHASPSQRRHAGEPAPLLQLICLLM